MAGIAAGLRMYFIILSVVCCDHFSADWIESTLASDIQPQLLGYEHSAKCTNTSNLDPNTPYAASISR